MTLPDEFQAYYPLTDAERKELWTSGTFVVDTNVLLHLHRFPRPAAEDLLTVLETLGDRLWVPHLVAVEYHQRLAQIFAEQKVEIENVEAKIAEVEGGLTQHMANRLQGRHTTLDPDVLSGTLKQATAEMKAHLAAAKAATPQFGDGDPIQPRVKALLSGRIGPGPNSQGDLDEMYREAEPLLTDKRPPGYIDFLQKSTGAQGASTAGDRGEVYRHNGLRYQSAYGDYVLWQQVLDEVPNRAAGAPLVLITDDRKEDWWHRPKGRTWGPRIELVHDAQKAGASTLTLLTSSRLLEKAQTELNVTLKADSVEQAEKGEALAVTSHGVGSDAAATALRLGAYATGGPIMALIGGGSEALRYVLMSDMDKEVSQLEQLARLATDGADQYTLSGARDIEARLQFQAAYHKANELQETIDTGMRALWVSTGHRARIASARHLLSEALGKYADFEQDQHRSAP